ncbi:MULTISPECIES: hypothetical protein [Thermus]|uniref:hypothetical protein n=1 Tax=Thermus TaxID=270 RepID=UPI0015628D88|nr:MULTISPECIES: hypothetical protein [Thermus]QWK21380.1 MAG: hypothetical protein KNN15_10145 [Thermus antranikianii]ULR41780.1 hypothetical protein MI302_05855 [Thermus sp. NEB1569]
MLRAWGFTLFLAWLWFWSTGDGEPALFAASLGLSASLVAWLAVKEGEHGRADG